MTFTHNYNIIFIERETEMKKGEMKNEAKFIL